MSSLGIKTKRPVCVSDISPAEFVAGSFYGNLHREVFTVSTFCNALKTFQIVGDIADVVFDLTLVSERDQVIVKIFDGSKPCIVSSESISTKSLIKCMMIGLRMLFGFCQVDVSVSH